MGMISKKKMKRGRHWHKKCYPCCAEGEFNGRLQLMVPPKRSRVMISMCFHMLGAILFTTPPPMCKCLRLIVSWAYMLYCILTGKGVNVGNIIANNILATATSSRNNAALIHPALIQWLCEKAKVKQIPSEPREKPAISISAQWINSKYYSKRHAQQLNARDRESQLGPFSSSLPPEPQGMSMSDLRPLLESILTNQREMREEQREMRAEQREHRLMSMGMQQDIQSLMQTQHRHVEMFMQMQAQWGAFQTGFVPPLPSTNCMERREEGDQPQQGGASGRFYILS